ncbi:MAG: thymidine phosphorylase [Endomicrobia bacterium]|nr:thymidine phosphorylase [Endomicrobiia bacterium]
MRMYDIIIKKRNNQPLTNEEIKFIVSGYVNGIIPDYQMSALLMAIYFNGMTDDELAQFTLSMTQSGKIFDLSHISKPKVDKHSTGGVGDGVSLSLAPLVASCDVVVPMISGRGLGHTGGTLDKLESIPGFTVNLSDKEFFEQLDNIGVVIAGQTDDLVPADKKIYALRDTTATVDSIPLIAASIMSKKIAEGTDALLLDVKTGNGAFMENYNDAVSLAKTMVKIGKDCGKKMLALITDMNQPLGEYIGNALEVYQAIEILKNEGPKDITELVIYESAKMLILAGVEKNFDTAKNRIISNLTSGKGLEKFKKLIEVQKGNPKIVDNPELLPQAQYCEPVTSTISGFVSHIDTKAIGFACCILGAGREKITDRIDHSVGLRIVKKLGDYVHTGEPIVYIYYNDKTKFEKAKNLILSSYSITEQKLGKQINLVYEEIL